MFFWRQPRHSHENKMATMRHVQTQCDFTIKDTANKFVQTVLKLEKREKRSHGCLDYSLEGSSLTVKKPKVEENEALAPEYFRSLNGKSMFQSVKSWLFSEDMNRNLINCLELVEYRSSKVYLEVTRKDHFMPECGMQPIKVVIDEDGFASTFLIFKGLVSKQQLFQEGCFMEEIASTVFQGILQRCYMLCPGLSEEAVLNVKKLPFTPVNVVIVHNPIERYASTDCLIWFKPPDNAPIAEIETAKYPCTKCRYVSRYTNGLITRRENKSEIRLNSRTLTTKYKTSPSSTHKLKYLSPRSLRVRQQKLRVRRTRLYKVNEKLSNKCAKLQLYLSDKKNEQMISITGIINKDFKDEVDKVLSELPSANQNDAEIKSSLKEAWINDSRQQEQKDKLNFQKDQDRNSPGRKANRWSAITYRMAQAIACRSKAAYLALQNFKILNLPSWRSVQTKMEHNYEEPGVNLERLKRQKEVYDDYVKEQVAKGLKKPLADGVLIFDEVNVAPKVAWNSKSHKLIGLAMSPHQLGTLDDIYEQMSSEETIPKAGYMLQFLWRDLTSDYDIIGPYFASEGSTNSHFISACLFDVLRAFHNVGFKVSVILCDGASSNLSLMKLTQNYSGAYGVKINPVSENIDVEIKPWFKNPFCLNYNIFWMMCPSHELKNLINALFASKENGSRCFKNNGVTFGWKSIIKMKRREDKRRDEDIPRYIPKLLESYITRDAWTKLNVKPAKIMQQDDVLAELYEHANPDHEELPGDALETMETHNYLKACNLLFENGMLSKSKVYSSSDPIMKNIDDGLEYFKMWLVDLKSRDAKFNCMYPGKEFLSWQTWDLLRVMVFGFKGLVNYYTKEYPGYYLMPIRLNGSAVESLFSQYKFNANGKITSINFAYARKALLTKEDVHGHHHSGKGYRDAALYVKQNFAKDL